jgi:hypothetical protein
MELTDEKKTISKILLNCPLNACYLLAKKRTSVLHPSPWSPLAKHQASTDVKGPLRNSEDPSETDPSHNKDDSHS